MSILKSRCTSVYYPELPINKVNHRQFDSAWPKTMVTLKVKIKNRMKVVSNYAG